MTRRIASFVTWLSLLAVATVAGGYTVTYLFQWQWVRAQIAGIAFVEDGLSRFDLQRPADAPVIVEIVRLEDAADRALAHRAARAGMVGMQLGFALGGR